MNTKPNTYSRFNPLTHSYEMIHREELLKRNLKIIKLRGEGLTYEEIGKRFGISRERARQVGKLLKPEFFTNQRQKSPRKIVKCHWCGKPVDIRLWDWQRDRVTGKKRHYYCNQKCSWADKRIYQSKEEQQAEMMRRYKIRYRQDPKVRQARAEASVKWIKKLKLDPVKWEAYREKQRLCSRKWHRINKLRKKKNEQNHITRGRR